MLMTISLQVCSFTLKKNKKVLNQFKFTFFVKFQFQIVKLSKSSCLSDIPLLRKRFLNLGMVHYECNNKQTLHIKLWFYFKRITLDQTVICILEFPQFPFSTNTLKLLLILTHFLTKITRQNIFFFWPFHCRQYFMIFQL